MFGGNTRRGRLHKANQAKLLKLEKELEFKTFLHKLGTGSCTLLQTADYCTELAIDLRKELRSHYAKRIEYSLTALDLVGPGPEDVQAPSYLFIKNEYLVVETRADIFCKKIDEGLDLRNGELEEIVELAELAVDKKLERLAKEDPVGIELKFEQAIAKAKEIKNEFDSLKAEWNAVKDELNNGIDDCIQLVNFRLHDLALQKLQAGEE